jgi:hypothetical protein
LGQTSYCRDVVSIVPASKIPSFEDKGNHVEGLVCNLEIDVVIRDEEVNVDAKKDENDGGVAHI